jgi:hypothetical protein
MTKARVTYTDRVVVLAEDETLTFGRATTATICLDPHDIAISRTAGTITHHHETWWIINNSSSRPLIIIDDHGFRSLLPPQRRAPIDHPTQIVIDGTHGQHNLRVTIDAPSDADSASDRSTGTSTGVGADVLVSPADRLAMIALFAGYLEDPPRYDPYPKSYAAAAARLGWRRTALIKRIEYLRKRLNNAGVPNMMGFSALTNLAEYALTRGLITRDDLHLLRGRAPGTAGHE